MLSSYVDAVELRLEVDPVDELATLDVDAIELVLWEVSICVESASLKNIPDYRARWG